MSDIMICPRCEHTQPKSILCEKCGIHIRRYLDTQRMMHDIRHSANARPPGRPKAAMRDFTPPEPSDINSPFNEQPAGARNGKNGHSSIVEPGPAQNISSPGGPEEPERVFSPPPRPPADIPYLTEKRHSPQQIGEIFSIALQTLKERGMPLTGLSLLSALLLVATLGATGILTIKLARMFTPSESTVIIALVIAAGLTATLLAWSLTVFSMVRVIGGHNTTAFEAMRESALELPSSMWLVFILGFVTVGTSGLFVLPGLLFMVISMFSIFVYALEGQKGLDAVAKSRHYVHRWFLNTCGKLAIILMISILLAAIPVVGPLFSVFFFPFLLSFIHAIYRDLKDLKKDETVPDDDKAVRLLPPVAAIAGYVLIALLAYPVIDRIVTTKLSKAFTGKSSQSRAASGGSSGLQSEHMLLPDKANYSPGEMITVRFRAPEGLSPEAWVGILPGGQNTESPGALKRRAIETEGIERRPDGLLAFRAPLSPGAYELIMVDPMAETPHIAAMAFMVEKKPLTASAADSEFEPGLFIEQDTYKPGEHIRVKFSAPSSYPDSAWIGIVPSDIEHGSEAINKKHVLNYQYIVGRTEGTLTFIAPTTAGGYDLRMNDSGNEGSESASVAFTVEKIYAPDPAPDPLGNSPSSALSAIASSPKGLKADLWLDRLVYSPGETIILHFTSSESYSPSAWIALVPADEPKDGRYRGDTDYEILNGRTMGDAEFKAPLAIGTYDFRLHPSSEPGSPAAAVTFDVSRPGAPLAKSPAEPPSTKAKNNSADQETVTFKAGDSLDNIMAYIYSLNYKGLVGLNGKEFYRMEGEKDMNYTYTGAAKLHYGKNVFVVKYNAVPEPWMTEFRLKVFRYDRYNKREEPIGQWLITGPSGLKSFIIDVEK